MDYTPYFYHYNQKVSTPITNNTQPNKCKHKGNLGHIILIVLILCSLLTALLLGAKFSDVNLVGLLKEDLSKNSAQQFYILTTLPSEYLEEARIKSFSLRLSGNAGYIYTKNNQYFVALATYLDKKTAEDVLSKNEDLVIHELTFFKQKLLDNATDDGITNQTILALNDSIKVLYDLSINLALKESSIVDVLHTLESTHSELLKLKQSVINLSPSNKDILLSIIDPPLGTLNAIISSTAHQSLLGELRYAVTISVVSLCNSTL